MWRGRIYNIDNSVIFWDIVCFYLLDKVSREEKGEKFNDVEVEGLVLWLMFYVEGCVCDWCVKKRKFFVFLLVGVIKSMEKGWMLIMGLLLNINFISWLGKRGCWCIGVVD